MKKATLHPYSDNVADCVIEEGGNVSGVIDKLIRLTAKITEHYASDIVYVADDLRTQLKHPANTWAQLLCFRESGVTPYAVALLRDSNELAFPNFAGVPPMLQTTEALQTWILKVDWCGNGNPRTLLQRVNVRVENG